MAAISNKYHISIGDFGFLLAKGDRTNRHIYTREEAPAFVNKFSSGEPNYRDSTFFPHWVQLNFLNGFNQEFFDDGGKFYRSASVDTTEQQKLQLEQNFTSAGLVAASYKIKTQAAWRAGATSSFGDGSSGALTISTDTTEAPIDSACTGTVGSTTLSATNASFAANQKILIIQSRGTSVGSYQVTKILSYSAGTITTEDPLTISYTTGAQVRVIPQYTSVTISSTKTYSPKAWNGTVGGILAFYCNGTLTVSGTLSAAGGNGSESGTAESNSGGGTGGGYRGGNAYTSTSAGNDSYKGEGTTGASVAGSTANGNGGGGVDMGDGYNTGAGGSHGSAGTQGGTGNNSTKGDVGSTVGDSALATLFFGGGGGGSATDGSSRTAGGGGAGGGIIFVYAKTIATITGSITAIGGNGGVASGSQSPGGGAGAGGSIYIKTQTIDIGTDKLTTVGGSGGVGAAITGGNGGKGRIAIFYATSIAGSVSSTYYGSYSATADSTLSDTPAGSSFTLMTGSENGSIYSWDGNTTFTELLNARRLEWYETGTDTDKIVGDTGGTETAQSQGFIVDAAVKCKAVQIYIKKNAGTPGDITCRIETNAAGVPSGTLVNANATATITAFTTTTYGWVTVEFPGNFTLSAATTYHLVLKTAAAANDQNYAWAADGSSPTYTDGSMSVSTDGGTTWAAVAAADAYFRILGNATSVNCSLVTSVGGTQKIYFGTGLNTATDAGDARLYSYNGTTWVLTKIFTSTSEVAILSIAEFGATTPIIYLGFGSIAKVYTTTDFSTFTLSKTITQPNAPGYVNAMKEYNGKLYVAGGFPSLLPGNTYQYSGFIYSYDEFSWANVFPFDHTVITSLETFDSLLFIGTIKKRLYVFNTASIDKLFDFPWDVSITSMAKYDDKLALAIAPTPGQSATTNEGVYLFDRNGFHNAFNVSGKTWNSVFVFNNNLMAGSDDGYIYQTSSTTYISSGTLQTSYDEASLPSIEKIRRDVTLMFESMPTGCSIAVAYKTDESDSSWTTLGTASTAASTTETFTFSSGVYSKKISYRITLATSNSANTPVLKKILHKYVLSPDFKYRWNLTLLCADDIIWQDGTEPVGILATATTGATTTITLNSNDTATPTDGFPDPNGSTMYASVINQTTGVTDQFKYTGKTSTTLTGVTLIGTNSVGDKVKVLGRDLHQKILDLKQTRQLFTFTDVDSLTYTVLFNSYQSNNWVVNQDDWFGGMENEVPIVLLQV